MQQDNSRHGPVNVLFVATDLSTGGGVNRVIRDLSALFAERLSAKVTVINARSSGEPTYAFPDGVSVEQGRARSLIAYCAFLVGLRRRRHQIVIGSWTQDNVLIALAFLFSRTKVVLVEHAPWQFHGAVVRALRRIAYPLASSVVVLNRRDLGRYRRFLSNVRLIADPVVALPTPTANREKLIVAVGHLEPVKNFADAIRAVAQSRLEEDGWSFEIIGSGSEEAKLRGLISELGLRRTSIRTTREDVGHWYARATLILVTSRMESFSLVLAEAMLSGVVPIAYASDGPAFILEDFPDHLVPTGDVSALTEKLSEFAHAAHTGPLRERLRKSIEERFSQDQIFRQWKELLF
jgi:glycosyltransferase involved in cell wall biosynthesis